MLVITALISVIIIKNRKPAEKKKEAEEELVITEEPEEELIIDSSGSATMTDAEDAYSYATLSNAMYSLGIYDDEDTDDDEDEETFDNYMDFEDFQPSIQGTEYFKEGDYDEKRFRMHVYMFCIKEGIELPEICTVIEANEYEDFNSTGYIVNLITDTDTYEPDMQMCLVIQGDKYSVYEYEDYEGKDNL